MGRLPESKADHMLKMCPAQLVKKPANKNTFQKSISKSDLTAALQQATVGGRGLLFCSQIFFCNSDLLRH